tara:strand:+ start:565 stop:741 length:177 start_codon:yes stop_codon:yes gene_type:complete
MLDKTGGSLIRTSLLTKTSSSSNSSTIGAAIKGVPPPAELLGLEAQELLCLVIVEELA